MIFDGFRLIAAPPPPSSGQVPALRAVVESLAAALLPVLSAFSILLLLISIGAQARTRSAAARRAALRSMGRHCTCVVETGGQLEDAL